MLEAKGKLPMRGLGDAPSLSGIRGGFDLAGRSRNGHEASMRRHEEDECILPESSRTASRRVRPRKSPSPSWYRRLPLRDITNIIHLMKERSIHPRATFAVQRGNEEAMSSPSIPFALSSPSIQESFVSELAPLHISASMSTGYDLSPNATNLKKDLIRSVDSTLVETSVSTLVISDSDQVIEMKKNSDQVIEMKKNSDLKEIQHILKRNLKKKKTQMQHMKPERSALMLMR